MDFYNHDILPIVYDRGSLGASGDLAPLANLFLPLIGLGEVRHKGEKRQAKDVLKAMGWKPIDLKSKEGLALLNGTQFMSAHGVTAMIRAFKIVKAADIIGALSLELSMAASARSTVHALRPHPGQIDTARNFRKILEGSQLISQPKKHVQDPYSFRCIPQVHGASRMPLTTLPTSC